MRVLVTGHTGYIGTRLVPILINAGHDVSGLDTDLFRGCTFTGQMPNIPHVCKDVRDVSKDDLTGFDAIIHLAALSNDPLGDYNPSLTEDINEKASVRIARLAREAGVSRFLFASSCSNYGAAGNDFLNESAPLNPVTPYGVSKVKVEKELANLADENFTPVYLRASTAYGLSPRIRFDLVLNNLTAWAHTTGKVHLKSDGSPWRPVVHIEDISRAYLALLEAPAEVVSNRPFNIGTTTENYQVKDLAEIVASVVPDCEVEIAPDAAPDERCYRVDCSRIALEIPGFKPQWTAERGATELYEAYKAIGLTLEEFEGQRFKRIAHVKHLIDNGKLDLNLRWTEGAVAA
ncbi:MAG: NAD-dependent epimerase/dehydratase family protein [Gammaproteobacteria bacterium]